MNLLTVSVPKRWSFSLLIIGILTFLFSRLDFTEFEIASPFECGGSTATVTCTTNDGPKHGDCYYDSFTVSTPGYLNSQTRSF